MTAAEVRRRRAAAQLLAGNGRGDVAGTVSHLLAVQAQDLRAARLALRARGVPRAADVDAALTEDRTVVVTWLMRGTLHLVAREDVGWLHALTGEQSAATVRRRLGQLGVGSGDAERAIVVIERALTAAGPLARPQLAERLLAAGIPAHGQAVPHLLALAAGRGTIVLGPLTGAGEHAFVLARDWLGASARPPERGVALAELARRYLRAHGPAGAADLAAWSGLGLRDARAGLTAIADELDAGGDHVNLAGPAGRPTHLADPVGPAERPAHPAGPAVDLAGRAATPARLPPRLLGPFDPYLLGWADRSFAVAPAHARRVHPGGGVVRATALANGRVVGTWTRRGGIEPFAPLPATVEAALRREAADVTRFERAAGPADARC